MDKAGSYGIQDYGSLLVKEIKGDYYTVVGFPISLVYRELENYNSEI
ncbi:Maf family protein [Peptostreptococcus porci]